MTPAEALAPTRQFQRVCEILDDHDRDPRRLIPILQAVQDEYRYLPQKVMAFVANALDVPPARVYGVATFYAHFALEPRGKHIVKLCDGTACHVRGSTDLLSAIRGELHLEDGQDTTDDMLFTVETVSCLGACGLAPVMVIDDEVHGLLTAGQAVELVRDVRNLEEARS